MRHLRVSVAAAAAVACAVPATASASPAASAASATPLRITSFALAPDGVFAPGDVLRVEARVRNQARSTIRGGRLNLYMRRKRTTHPRGQATASGRVPAVRGRSAVRASAEITVRPTATGVYRLIACVTSRGHARRCRVVRGVVTIRSR